MTYTDECKLIAVTASLAELAMLERSAATIKAMRDHVAEVAMILGDTPPADPCQ